MTSGHLITHGDLSLLSDINTNSFVYARIQLVPVLSCEYSGLNDDTIFTVRNLQGCIAHFSRLLTKDRTKKPFLGCQFRLALRRHLAYQNISGTDLGAYADDSTLIQIFKCIFAHAGNILCDLLRSELCITGFRLILFDMNRCINIILNQSLTDQNGILVIVAFPLDKSNERILSERKFSTRGGRTVRDNFAGFYMHILIYNRTLVITVALVASHEFRQMVYILRSVIIIHAYLIRSGICDRAGFSCHNADT